MTGLQWIASSYAVSFVIASVFVVALCVAAKRGDEWFR